MKLENQVVSLELAKKFKELGFRKKGYFAWYANPYHGEVGAKHVLWEYKEEGYPMKHFSCYAYTVAELGEMLPNNGIEYTKGTDVCGEWACGQSMPTLIRFKDDKEANARAKMLIYLKENKLI